MASAGEVKIILAADAATYTAALQKARAQLGQLAGDATRASAVGQKLGRDLAAAGHASVQPWMASSAALRLLEGDITNNIRAGERFVASFKPLQGVLMKAFPVIGAIALTGIVIRLTEKIVNYREEMDRAAKKALTVWRGVDAPIRASVDEMTVANDKIADAIAKLEGKPRNGIKDAIDEAILAAGKLGDALNEDIAKMQATLQAQQTTLMQRFGGAAGTTDISDRALDLQMKLQNLQLAGDQKLEALAKGGNQKKVEEERQQLTKQYNDLLRKEIDWVKAQMMIAPSISISKTLNSAFLGNRSSLLQDQSNRERNLTGYLYGLTETQKFGAAFNDQVLLTNQRGDLESAKAVAEAQEKALAPLKRAIAAIGEMAKQYDTQVAEYRRSPDLISPQPLYDVFGQRGQTPEGITRHPDYSLADNWGGYEEWSKGMSDRGRAISDWLKQMNESVKISRQSADSIARVSIEMEKMTGRMSNAEAAQALAALHAQEFAESLRRIDDAMNAAAAASWLGDIERNAQLQGLTNQRTALVGQYGVTRAEDEAAIRSATAMGALRQATDELAQRFSDAAAHLASFATGAVEGFNQTFAGSAMAYSRNGWEYRRNMENAFAGEFRNQGARLLTWGLQAGEGSLLKHFGFGGGKRQPVSAWIENWPGASASSPGGIVSSAAGVGGSTPGGAAGLFNAGLGLMLHTIPGFAAGGDIPSNMPAIVGERGPELFMPSTSGRIVPNDQLGGLGAGALHLHVDARGAPDPAAVEMAIHRAVNGLRAQVPAIALAAHREYNRQRPGTSRI